MRNFKTLHAIVSGTTPEDRKEFEYNLTFTLIPPHEGVEYYGNGHLMLVQFDNGNEYVQDVRYSDTTNLYHLAERYILANWSASDPHYLIH